VVQDKQIYIPPSLSPEAQELLKSAAESKTYAIEVPGPDDLAGWQKAHALGEQFKKEEAEQALAASRATATDIELGGVPVLDLRPQGWTDNGKVVVYIHSGGYTLLSAHSTLAIALPMVQATGLRVVSVEYTPAPGARFDEIQRQILSVFDALSKAGYAMKDIAIFGDSAGGTMSASTVLNLRDQGKGMPAAAVFWSADPDLSSPNDSTVTLDPADPILTYSTLLVSGSKAYAGDVALDDARVAPFYADLSKGFSPALIVAGTKEMLLSSSVRFYQKLEAAGQSAKLDVYEGMWHVFPQYDLPESRVAVAKSAKFVNDHLDQTNP
jgi:epsilon-lactone hydrolase